MKRPRLVRCAIVVGGAGLLAGSAAAQDAPKGACFDIIAGNTDTQLAGTILLNRCSGQTWILVRNQRRTADGSRYQWSLLANAPREEPPPTAKVPTAKSPPAKSATTSGKCFTFQQRRFCE